MKRSFKFVPAVILVAVLGVSLRAAPASDGSDVQVKTCGKSRFSLKLGGGLAMPDMGDINGMIRSYNDASAAITAAGQTSAVSWNKIKTVGDFSLELQYALTDHISLGLETGYMYKKFPGTWSLDASYAEGSEDDYIDSHTNSYAYEFNDSVSVIPVVLSGYYFIHAGDLDVYFKGGLGIYFGRYELNRNTSESLHQTTNYYSDGTVWRTDVDNNDTVTTYHGVAHDASLGLNAGLGLEWKLTGRLSLNIEGIFRTVDLNSWKGYLDSSGTSTTVSGSESEGLKTTTSKFLSMMDYSLRYGPRTYNLGDDSANVKSCEMTYSYNRAARILLDGLSVKVGFKIRL